MKEKYSGIYNYFVGKKTTARFMLHDINLLHDIDILENKISYNIYSVRMNNKRYSKYSLLDQRGLHLKDEIMYGSIQFDVLIIIEKDIFITILEELNSNMHVVVAHKQRGDKNE